MPNLRLTRQSVDALPFTENGQVLYGSHRMFDLAGSERKNRKGFATGSGDETKTEYFWCRMPNGEYAISVLAEDDRESPF